MRCLSADPPPTVSHIDVCETDTTLLEPARDILYPYLAGFFRP